MCFTDTLYMTNHEDLMAAALKAVENVQTHAEATPAATPVSEEGGSGLDSDSGISLSTASLGEDIRQILDENDANIPEFHFDIDLSSAFNHCIHASQEAACAKADNAKQDAMPDSASGGAVKANPVMPINQEKKIVPFGVAKAACAPTSKDALSSSSSAKQMMLENLVQTQKIRISSLEKEVEEERQKNASAAQEDEQLHAQIKALNDRLIRLSADFDNYRKRVIRDQEQNKEQAEERIVSGLLPVIDNLERAIEHARQSQDFDRLLQGVEMTHKLYAQALAKLGCTPFESVGKSCDPNYHDVLQRVIDEEKEHNTVVQEHLKGYMMHDRVLRPALVVVAQHSEDENLNSSHEDE